eukprot:scaffold707_cov145-Isochrysis_galbana.AAC.2
MNRSRDRPSPLARASHIGAHTNHGCTFWNLRRGALLIKGRFPNPWHEAAADEAAAAFRPEGRSSSTPISMMPPVPTPRCALFPRTARLLSGLLQPACPHARFSTGPQPDIPYPRIHLS